MVKHRDARPADFQLANLVTTQEIAERAGVTPAAVSNWSARWDDFPGPIIYRPGATLYWWPDVTAWLRKTGRIE